MSTPRWKQEKALAEKVFALAEPHLRGRPNLSPDVSLRQFVRDEIGAGEWAAAVSTLLQSFDPGSDLRSEIRRLWVDGQNDPDARSVSNALQTWPD